MLYDRIEKSKTSTLTNAYLIRIIQYKGVILCMKRKDLIKKLDHNEITAKKILKKWGLH